MQKKPTTLSQEFERSAAAPPPQLATEGYRLLLEKLVTSGKGYGKTMPVAAYKLRNIHIVRETDTDESEHQIEMPDLYVIMDPSVWPNEYIRKLGMEDIASKWARRLVTEGKLNAADYKGPGIWTIKKSAFEEDYQRREGVNEDGLPINIYDPNPDAHRLCLNVNTPITIPTPWGQPYPIGTDGTVAVREKDVAALIDALQSIREGKISAAQALFTHDNKGNILTRFDVYGMEPLFLRDNYDSVPLKETTQKRISAFDAGIKKSPAILLTEEPMLPALEAIAAKNKFHETPENGANYWSGGGMISIPEDRKQTTGNKELISGLVYVNNTLNQEAKYTTVLQKLTPWGDDKFLLPSSAAEVSHFEEVDFRRRVSAMYTKAARGIIHTAVSQALPNSNFRLYEYNDILLNNKITHVEIVTGRPTPEDVVPYIDTFTNVFNRTASFEDWSSRREAHSNKRIVIFGHDMIFDETLITLPKHDWAAVSKTDWFQSSRDKLIKHLNQEELTPSIHIHGVYYYDPADHDVVRAKARFLSEVFLSLRSLKDHPDAQTAEIERKNLQQSYELLKKYPEVLYFDEPPTLLEAQRSRLMRFDIPRSKIITQDLGDMLFKIDTSLSLADKNRLWGRYNHYDHSRDVSNIPAGNLGLPQETENYVREKLAKLMGEIRRTLHAETQHTHKHSAPKR